MQDNRPLASIIVRTKDRPKLLMRALRSIAAQTYRPLEAVLVNDGGCDLDIAEITAVLGDVSLNYQRLESNRGRAHAANVGIAAAQGAYLGFLDDDDELYPEHLQTLVTFLLQGDHKVAYADTEMVCPVYSSEEGKTVDTVTAVFSSDFSYDELLINNYIPFNSLLFRADVLDRQGCLDESFNLYEDWDLLIRLAGDRAFCHIPKTTAKYYQWSSQSQINQSDADYMRASHLKVIEKHLHRFTPEIVFRMKQKRDALSAELDGLRREGQEKTARIGHLETRIAGLDRQVLVMEGLIQERDGLLAGRDRLIAGMEEKVREKDAHIRQQEESIAGRDEAIRDRDAHIARLKDLLSRQEALTGEKEEHILRLLRDLEAIKSTRGWKFLEGMRRVKGGITPSQGGEVRRLASRSAEVLRREGLAAFLRKARDKAAGSGPGPAAGTPPAPVASPVFTDEPLREHFPTPRAFRVLLVKWEWAGITNHYRVDNMAEYLQLGGTEAEVMDLASLAGNIPRIYEFDVVIIHRIPMHPLLREFIGACRKRGIVVVFDIDDYLFEASVAQEIEWVRHTNPADRDRLIEHMMQCRETLEACDYFIAPTDFLKEKAEELGRKAYVVRNGFSRELYRQFTDQGAAPAGGEPVVRIGYFSGTNTHQKDFQSVAPAILRILKEFDHARLYICGLLDVGESFGPYSHRIEKVPLVPLEGLPDAMAPCHINIAPLEPGNIFCEAKSELKYMYAGIMEIPTVASPTDAFRHAITHGENGFLATADDEWYACLKRLVGDPALRKEMGGKARAHVAANYAPEALSRAVHAAYREAITRERRERGITERSLSVGIVFADREDNSGRYRQVMDVAGALTARGHRVDRYYYGGNGAAASPGDAGHIMACDVLVCTDPHNSAVTAHRNRARAAHLVFLASPGIEGIPYPWGESFRIIDISSDAGAAAGLIEDLVWKTADRAKS